VQEEGRTVNRVFIRALPLRDINGQPLVDECWGVFNGKQVVDFFYRC
jgi:hypothetical protein